MLFRELFLLRTRIHNLFHSRIRTHLFHNRIPTLIRTLPTLPQHLPIGEAQKVIARSVMASIGTLSVCSRVVCGNKYVSETNRTSISSPSTTPPHPTAAA